MTPLLKVLDVKHRFRGLEVLRGVDFAVPEGTITGLIGPNGAGKSTLFNIISGFLRPLHGEIVYANDRITRKSVQARSRAGLMRTFQTPQVFHNMTVRDNLIVGGLKQGSTAVLAGLLGLPRARREIADAGHLADETTALFGLDAIKQQFAGELPAGQRRLVELARAVIGKPRLLCLDEPSSGLNNTEIDQLMAALRRLNGAGITILLVSHDMNLVDVASRIHVLCFGRIIASGSFSEVKSNRSVREAYLGF